MSTGGETKLIGVAHAGDRAEAEMVQGLLESEGIPSIQQPVGVDGTLIGIGVLNPAGGSRQIMVRAEHAEQARALLAQTPVASEQEESWTGIANAGHLEDAEGRGPRNYGLIGAYARIWAWSLGIMALAFAVFLLLRL